MFTDYRMWVEPIKQKVLLPPQPRSWRTTSKLSNNLTEKGHGRSEWTRGSVTYSAS
jgi:hypothetical protein